MKVGIIGGGASGILCAILIKSNNPKIDVTILEQNDRIGKKLLQTGNGCCNLDNVNSSDYHKYNTPLIKELISKYDYKFIMRLFNDLGLACMIDDEGRIYPYSKKATNVLDILLANLSINSVNVKTGIEVKDIKKINNQFIVNSEFVFDDLVLSCGGKASINSEYKLKNFIRSFGMNWVEGYPSLCPVKVKENVKALSGIRVRANVKYYKGLNNNWSLADETNGEVLFKDEGLSGISIFEVSRNYDGTKQNKVVLDLFSDYTIEKLTLFIQNNYHKFVSLVDALIGLVPKMIALDVIKKSNNDIRKIAYLLKNYEFNITNVYDYNQAQVMRGGVDLNSIKLDNLESIEEDNLYVIGEGLNVDGTCGGFNLHFAWVSALACAKSIVIRENHFN